ncbi:MAG: aspartyl protease family protein [Caulobacteraceae bacterium]
MISRRALLTQAAGLALAGAGAWWLRDSVLLPTARASFDPGASSSGWLPFSAQDDRVVIVSALVNGTPVQALVDSGAQSSVIDRGLALRLGLPLSVIPPVMALGVSGKPQLGRTTALEVRLGALRLRLRAAVLELNAISVASGLPFGLMLGQDVLQALVADMDFPARRLSLHDPASYQLPAGAVPTPARLQGRELLVPVTVEGAALDVVLDTGASGAISLAADVAEAAGLVTGRAVEQGVSISFGGVSPNRIVRARSFIFAGRRYIDTPIQIYSARAGGMIPKGLLGVEMLKPYRVTLDQGRSRLHLIPGGRDGPKLVPLEGVFSVP